MKKEQVPSGSVTVYVNLSENHAIKNVRMDSICVAMIVCSVEFHVMQAVNPMSTFAMANAYPTLLNAMAAVQPLTWFLAAIFVRQSIFCTTMTRFPKTSPKLDTL